MEDELDFFEFVALFNLFGKKLSLSDFILYHPKSDQEYAFHSLKSNEIIYSEEDGTKRSKEIEQLREWIVICPLDSPILLESKKIDSYCDFKFRFSLNNVVPTLQSKNMNFDRVFEKEISSDIEVVIQDIKREIDQFLLSDEFFRKTAKKLSDNFNYRTYYLKINNVHHFKTFEEQTLSYISYIFRDKVEQDQCSILETSGEGELEKLQTTHTNKLVNYILDKALSDNAYFKKISEYRSIGGVIDANYIEFGHCYFLQVSLDGVEVFSELCDGLVEKNLSGHLNNVIEEHEDQVNELVEKNHRKFKSNLARTSPVNISYNLKKYSRFTHCWKCKSHINNISFATCGTCDGGIICFCGACLCGYYY